MRAECVQAMFHEHVGALVVHYKARTAGAPRCNAALQRSTTTLQLSAAGGTRLYRTAADGRPLATLLS